MGRSRGPQRLSEGSPEHAIVSTLSVAGILGIVAISNLLPRPGVWTPANLFTVMGFCFIFTGLILVLYSVKNVGEKFEQMNHCPFADLSTEELRMLATYYSLMHDRPKSEEYSNALLRRQSID